MFENIPEELKQWPQWVLWRYKTLDNGKNTKVPYSPVRLGHPASVSDPSTWGTFEHALTVLRHESSNYAGLGFVLTEQDPFAFIDLDDCEGDGDLAKFQVSVFESFRSYAERSPSGKGLHIVVKGSVPVGRKQNKVEIYSSLRFMTVTGDVYRAAPIANYSELLLDLWGHIGPQKDKTQTDNFEDCEQTKTDEEIYNIAANAVNGEKFEALWNGHWENFYQSQSEADLALIDILAYYTQNREQVVRMFRLSALGKREKANRDQYVNYMLKKCFDNQLPNVDTEGLKMQFEEFQKGKVDELPTCQEIRDCEPNYSLPPGLVGEIASFIYDSAPRPVPEIALAGAIGLMSGIVGRSYNISGTGLNQYVLLLAPTGTGKEAIASATDKIIASVMKTVPAAVEFIGPGEIASAGAAIKYMSRGPTSFVSLVGEFGIFLQQMTSINAPSHAKGFRRFLLDVYNKSGEGKVLRPSVYSDKDNNTNAIFSPALTLLGESTPEKFYEGLHEGLIDEGLLPRFTIIEYSGKRPGRNKTHLNAVPPASLVEKVAALCAHSLMLNSGNKTVNVTCTDEALEFLDRFDEECDDLINSSARETKRQLWNRAHIKTLKLAAIVAVGCDPYHPTITLETAQWARKLILADVENIQAKFESGVVGASNEEGLQIKALVDTIKEYTESPWSKIATYKAGTAAMHAQKVIPYSFLHRKLSSAACYRKDRTGATNALKRSIKTLAERGDIVQLPAKQIQDQFESGSQCFAIKNPQAFL